MITRTNHYFVGISISGVSNQQMKGNYNVVSAYSNLSKGVSNQQMEGNHNLDRVSIDNTEGVSDPQMKGN